MSTAVFYDEEECLGFDVFVAELELIVGTRKDKRPDEVQLLQLLQKLLASVSRTEKAVLRQYQKRCEAALVDVLYKGTCRTVRSALVPRGSKAWDAPPCTAPATASARWHGVPATSQALIACQAAVRVL
jgi:hypothetical protein